ncbi:MAG TPA: type I methionyl aminopeptidase [Deltaproteobacteria bacterium]|nr:type I methionyl aminopeptidase [Deltaproteobacteria bacterium]
MATVKDPWELALMRQSGRRLAEVVALLRESVRPGVTTAELDDIAERAIIARNSKSSFKGYTAGGTIPFPGTICASPNEQVVHGFPNEVPLGEGDIISIDVGLIYGGYHADCAFTVAIGEVAQDVQRLLDETEQSLYKGIAQARPGNRIGDIGHAIQSFIEPRGYGIVREFVGHGIGRLLHETPSVPNYGPPNRGHLLMEGFCLAIEPMITMGHHETDMLDDGWTVVTADGSLAAHFEHTVAVTPKGPEILTVLDDSLSHPG